MASTCIGVIVAMELGIPKAKFEAVIEYLQKNSKGFEEDRIVAAALEAWGLESVDAFYAGLLATFAKTESAKGTPSGDDPGRFLGSAIAMRLRLGDKIDSEALKESVETIGKSQRPDGGWGKHNEKSSDLESTYRVMRAFMLMKQKPANFEKVKAYVEKCRNKDGGAGVKPGEPSSMSGAYYSTIISSWMKLLEK